MTDTRTPYLHYFEDLARRHASIAHDPATESSCRFFIELDYEKTLGSAPDNTGWNLVLMGYETSLADNHHGERYERVSCIFDVLKHVADNAPLALQAVYAEARIIGWEILNRVEYDIKHCEDRQLSAGIVPPYSIVMDSLRTVEVGPRWDGLYGYRFILDILQETDRKPVPNGARWRALPGDPPLI